jgi:hypothetical protein|tara:strand:- start:4157 stop:4408 length:252 start_codon:yes stop_codon:yes gene_type:complete
MKESTATIKLTKSEMEWTIIALVWMEKSSEEFRRPHDASMFKKLRKDFVRIKEDIIHGEKQLEKKQHSKKEVSSSQKPCKNCS